MERRLYSIEEAADYLGLKKSTLYTWARRRRISSVKIGRRLLFDQRDLDSLIEKEKRRAEEDRYAMTY
jgi:excisionase family DNA binding protein